MLISDIDGCIFNNHHRAHLIPTDRTKTSNWTDFNKACLKDIAVTPVIDFIKKIVEIRQCKITFLTSRGEDARAETEQQLNMFFNNIPFDLHMRPMSDHRCTVDFKRDVIQRLSPMFNPNSLIVDDHSGIITMCAKDFPLLNRLLVKSYDCTVAKDTIEVVNLDAAIDYIEHKTGRKVINSSFEDNTLTARLSGDIKSINISGTLSFDNQSKDK